MVPGNRLGRYTLLGKLATGGMAEVLLARQDGPQGFAKTVVVKRILPHFTESSEFVRMFLDEAKLAALINHPNVVSIYELGEDPTSGTFFIAMEYIDGCTLKRLAHVALQQGVRIPLGICARVIADVCGGLDYAHNLKDGAGRPLNLVHRDISPENILLTYGGQAKVVDFGIAKASTMEGRTATGQVKGKFSYMSPEALLGQPSDRRADIWALGVTLYWLCAGVRPFRGENEGQLVQKVLNTEAQPLVQVRPEVPVELASIVHRALAKDQDNRYPTARAMQEDLERWLGHGHNISTGQIADFMGELFPEATDADRVGRRSLLSGEAPAYTPGSTDLFPMRSGSGSGSSVDLPISFTESRLAPRPRSRRPVAISLGVAAASFAVGLGLWHPWSRSLAAAQPPSIVAREQPAPPPPAPAPVAPPTANPAPTAPVHAEPSAKRHAMTSHASAEKGFLAVRVAPWASVFVDGEKVGTTPFAPVPVSPGSHRIRLENTDLNVVRDLKVSIQPGRTYNLKARLE